MEMLPKSDGIYPAVLASSLRIYWLDLPGLAKGEYDAVRIISIVVSLTIKKANTRNLHLDTEAAPHWAVDMYVRRKS